MSSIQTFSVNRKPFTAPKYLSVVRSEGFSGFGDAILALPIASVLQTSGCDDDDDAFGSSPTTKSAAAKKKRLAAEEDSAGAGSSSAAATAAAAGGGDSSGYVDGAVVVRKYEDLPSRPRALASVTRMLALQQQLPHPQDNNDVMCLVPILDAYVETSSREHVYVVIPQYPTTLASFLSSRATSQLSADQILFILHQLTCAVRCLHRIGVVVGEIRPEAVFLLPDKLGTPGSVRFGDFSLCHLPKEFLHRDLKVLDPSAAPPLPQAQYSSDNAVPSQSLLKIVSELPVTSPEVCYRAPEWALELVDHISPAADVWALGACFVELITRRPLWTSEKRTPAEYIERVSQLFGYPVDDSYMTNKTAQMLWKSTSESWLPIGVASLLSIRKDDASARAMLLLARKMLQLEPSKRLDVEELLHHPLLRGFTSALAPPGFAPSPTAAGGGSGGGPQASSPSRAGPTSTTNHANNNHNTTTRQQLLQQESSSVMHHSTGGGISSPKHAGHPHHHHGHSSADAKWAVDVTNTTALVECLYGECVRVLD